jgi:hypothetical protein
LGYQNRPRTLSVADVMDSFLLILSLMCVILAGDLPFRSVLISTLTILISIHLFVKSRHDTNFLLLTGFMAYINISLAFSDFLGVGMALGQNTLDWQADLRASPSATIAENSVLIFLSVFNVLLGSKFIRQASQISKLKLVGRDNAIIFYGLLAVLFLFWSTGYSESQGAGYESVTRASYEYCVVVFPLMWFYSGRSRLRMYLMGIFVVLYIGQSLIRGDRSSAFPLILMILLLGNLNLNMLKTLSLLVAGFVFSALIAVYRLDFSSALVSADSISQLTDRGLTIDTVSQSFYTAISIIDARGYYPNPEMFFFNFLAGIVLGGWFPGADVIVLAENIHFNRAGGFFFSWFYFWFGYIGVAFSAVFLALYLRKVSTSLEPVSRIYLVLTVAFCVRWYVYTPLNFFRSILFVLSVLVVIAFIVDRITRFKIQ